MGLLKTISDQRRRHTEVHVNDKSDQTSQPLYGLQKLAERPDAPVMICEGEKAADAAGKLLPSMVTISSPICSKGVRADLWPLIGRRVIIWPNADAAGLEHAIAVADEASIVDAAAVAIIPPPPGCKAGWNAVDAQAEGWDERRATELVAVAYNRDDYPHRKLRRRQRDGYVAGLLDELHRLEEQTHPIGGVESAKEKDRRSLHALHVAGQLVNVLAGWALDHQVGLALENLKSVRYGPLKMRKLPEYLDGISKVDDHRHERGGKESALNPAAARRAIINVLRAYPGGLTLQMQKMVLSPLEVQEYKKTPYRKVTLPVLQLQFDALCFIEYRIGLGDPTKVARGKVAKMLEESDQTVRGWKSNVCKQFNRVEVTRAFSVAYNVGTQDRARPERASLWQKKYGEEALVKLGEQYNRAKFHRQ